jgi:hypothetical protein
MLPTEGNMYTQSAVLEQMMRRWDEGNWSELAMLMLKRSGKIGEVVHTVAFQTELKRILEEDRAECAEYLQTHAFARCPPTQGSVWKPSADRLTTWHL